jgi:HK97 family phage major capsid protein
MDPQVQTAIDALGKTAEEFKATNAKALAELAKAGEVRGETETKIRKLDEAIQKAEDAKVAGEKATAAAERVLAAARQPMGNGSGSQGTPDQIAHKEAVSKWLRKGTNAVSEADLQGLQRKALSSLSDPDGGYYLSFDSDAEIIKVITETSPMREVARVMTIGNPSIKGRLRQGRAGTGGWVGEADTRPVTTTPQVGEWEIVAREMYANPDAPQSFLDDATISAEQWLSSEVAEEFSVVENTAWVLGNGVKRPRGLLTYASGTDPLQSQVEQVATATNDVFAADDLITIQQALKEPYQANASWLMSRQMLGNVRRFVLGSVVANYVWQPGLQQGVPSTILGRPYRLMADFPTAVADQALIVAYGDFARSYLIVDRAGITVLRNPFTTLGYVSFYTTKRTGGGVVNFEAYKILRVQ